jgi:tetratricopeptide (TPR) repeat protein
LTIPPTASSAEYVFSGVRRHKLALLAAAGVIAAALAAFYYYAATRPIDSIAVIPFHSGAAEAEDEQLGDEVTKQVINGLSKLSPKLRVVPFNSVHRLKGKSAQEVGRELNVRAVLTVEAKKVGDALTVSTELVDLRDNRLLWGASQTAKLSDLGLASQNIIAPVSENIGLKLSAGDENKRKAEALYAEGRNAWNKRKVEDIKKAEELFNQALNLDPNNASAWAGLADCYNMLGTYGGRTPLEAFPQARNAALRALNLNRDLAEAHAALAYAKFRGEWDWAEAEREFKEAIRLKPDYASAHQWYANYLAARGRFPEAVEETRTAQGLDKYAPIIQSHLGLIYFFMGNSDPARFEDAIRESRRTLEQLDPNFFAARRYMGLAYAQTGKYKEAVEEYEKAVDASKGSPLIRAEYASVLALKGETEKAQAELKKILEMREKKEQYISAYHLATVYVSLKDRDNALRLLEQAAEERADWLVFLNVDPRFKGLRTEPRFTGLLRRMKLE